MRAALGMLVVAVAVNTPSVARADPIKADKADATAEKVVGKWRLTKANGTEINNTTVEFTKDGKMVMTLGVGEDAAKYVGTYKVVKETIDYKIDVEELKKAEVLKIKKIDSKAMTTEDPDGIVEEFEKEDKKDDKKEEKKKDPV
jgi:uncharacterized protein (TIGR03066 family)